MQLVYGSQAQTQTYGVFTVGRLAARELLESDAEVELVHINDICAVESAAYLLKYDSVHGKHARTHY